MPLYRALGDWMKQGATGGRGYVLTGSPRLAKEVGLRPSRRIPFVVGDIECRLLEFPFIESVWRDFADSSHLFLVKLA